MKKLILVLWIVLLLPSCAKYWEYFNTYFLAFNHISMHFTKQILKHIKYCEEECKANKEQSDEWCTCMEECYRMKYDSPDENITFCLPDSTNSTPSNTINFN